MQRSRYRGQRKKKKCKSQTTKQHEPHSSPLPPLAPSLAPAAKAQDYTAAPQMAIPTMELQNIYDAGEAITSTVEAMNALRGDLDAIEVVMWQRKQQLHSIKDKLIADMESGNILPYSTQNERVLRCLHIDALIEWIEITLRALNAVALILCNVPKPPGIEEVN